jgi:hypothetical protein
MRGTKIAVLIVVAVAGGWATWRMIQDHGRSVRFDQIVLGNSKHDVVAVLGKPDRILPGCGYLGATPVWDCAEEHIYRSFLSVLTDEAWTISFDKSDRAVHKAHFLFP